MVPPSPPPPRARLFYARAGGGCVQFVSDDVHDPATVLAVIFNIFDVSRSGVVDRVEVVCGLSALCGGAREGKLRQVFEILNRDGTGAGHMTLQDLVTYLTGA